MTSAHVLELGEAAVVGLHDREVGVLERAGCGLASRISCSRDSTRAMCQARIAGPAIFGCSTSPVATRIRRRRVRRCGGIEHSVHVLERLEERASSMLGCSGVPNSGVISWSGRRRSACSSRRDTLEPGERVDEGVDRVGRSDGLLVDGEELARLGVGVLREVERACVVAAERDAPPDRQQQRGGQHRAQVVVVVVLEDREQRVALEEEVLAPRAEPSRGRVVAVVRDRPGHVADAVAEQPEPPTEVDVLEEHEVAVVEPADAPEDLGTDHHRGARREQHVGRGVLHRARRLPKSTLKPWP